MNHASESALVAIITTLVAISCLGVIYRFRSFIVRERLFIPYVCLTWSIIAIVVTAVVASAQSDPAEGIFTTKSWFSYGWNTGMSMFSIRINTWNRYLFVIIYQVLFAHAKHFFRTPHHSYNSIASVRWCDRSWEVSSSTCFGATCSSASRAGSTQLTHGSCKCWGHKLLTTYSSFTAASRTRTSCSVR